MKSNTLWKNHLQALLPIIMGATLAALILAASAWTAKRTNAQTGDILRPGVGDRLVGFSTQNPTDTITNSLYLPLIQGDMRPVVELLGVWTGDAAGGFQPAFTPTLDMSYISSGRTNRDMTIPADIELIQSGPCESGVIYSGTIDLAPGEWQQASPSLAGECAGVYTTTTQISYEHAQRYTATLTTRHVVNYPSQVVLSQAHGFDKCYLPTLDQMQTWWDESPYAVFNLYLGGSSFYCDDQPLDAVWAHRAADQGWTFILTWVGPQAPCTGFTNRMSWNPEAAYIEGRLEALYASQAARQLGFLGDQVIYYDMEGYTNNSSGSCSTAVAAFIEGWTQELHEGGFQAGGYGSGCRSYISEWADNQPPPDDVWIAHWVADPFYYDEEATVWDAACVSNDLWPDHQRLKQYAGGHKETWGGESLTIDSNVLDGAITAIPMTETMTATTSGANPVVMRVSGPQVSDMDLLNASQGWVLVKGQLLATNDGGQNWQDLTPNPYQLLGAAWGQDGDLWVVGMEKGSTTGLQAGRSLDGGSTWNFTPLGETTDHDETPIESAHLDVIDGERAWVSVELTSGSSFSRGRLFATQDGGRTWQERSAPVGGQVAFQDAQHGWLAGGPAGGELFATQDGGRTWQRQSLDTPTDTHPQIGLPSFSGEREVSLPVRLESPQGDKLAVYTSQDGGQSWQLSRIDEAGEESAHLKTGSLLSGRLLNGYTQLPEQGALLDLDFVDAEHGWALVQQGSCQGEKRGSSEQPLQCQQRWRLLDTQDSGLTWTEINPG